LGDVKDLSKDSVIDKVREAHPDWFPISDKTWTRFLGDVESQQPHGRFEEEHEAKQDDSDQEQPAEYPSGGKLRDRTEHTTN
jgi:hypothetical protein